MAKKNKGEQLLSYSPKKKADDNIDDWVFLDDDEEEELLDEPLTEEPVAEVLQEEPVDEVVEPITEVVEEVVDEPIAEAIEDEVVPEEIVEEVSLDEVQAEEITEDVVGEEVLEEVELEDVVAEDYYEEVEPEEVEVEDVLVENYEEPKEVSVAPIVIEEYDEKIDKTNIFKHAAVYYDQNTTILPRNFESRMKLADDDVKKLYSDIKNVLMEYSGVKSRMLKYVEVFRCGGVVAKLRIKGKSLYAYLKLDPSSVDQNYLKIVDKSERRGYEETPAEIKVTGKRKCKRTIEMIRLMMDALQVGHRRHPEVVDYVAKYPTPENAVILGKNMVKVSKRSDYIK